MSIMRNPSMTEAGAEQSLTGRAPFSAEDDRYALAS